LFLDIFIGATGSAVGAFLGFLGALYIQYRAEKRTKKDRDDLVLRNIKDEISDISSSLNEYLKKQTPLTYNIQTPNWDAALYSGAILEFIKNPVYAKTINVYSHIKRFNSMRNSLNKEDNLSNIKDIVDASIYITNEQEK